MEPLDPTKNDESSGFSKRRISSILKAPRTSMRFPNPEQQENVVESAKPVEKRNSRRVSFAPANDVLLFSKDVKNASPARSPLQEFVTTPTATQNRVQVAVDEDGAQQIKGMETLLNAPLHTTQQRDKVNFECGGGFGEKTMIFSTDEAFMDMTHSHTINIANDAELLADVSPQNVVLPTSGEKTVMFTADDGSMDMTLNHTLSMTRKSFLIPAGRNMDLSVEKISSSVPCLDPEFENFLASLSKPRGSSINPAITKVTPPAGNSSEDTNSSLKTQRCDVDKENQAPASVSAVMEKLLTTSTRTGDSSRRSALCPEDKDGDDEDPFQCLFPTQEMYLQAAETAKQQQSSTTPASVNPKETTSKNLPHRHQMLKVNLDEKDECREKTILYTAGDEFMDMTQSHTVHIASGSVDSSNQNLDIFNTHGKMDNASGKRGTCSLPGSSASGSDQGFNNFCAGLSKTSALGGNPVNARMEPPAAASTRSFGESFEGRALCPENDVSMDMTETQTGRITRLTGSDDPFKFLFPTQDSHRESVKSMGITPGQTVNETLRSSNCAGVETSLRSSIKTKVQKHQIKFDAEDDCREKTLRFSADDACMDVTRSHTVNIATNLELQSQQNLDFLPSSDEKTVKFTANDADMDMTQCLTVNIASNLASDSVPLMKKQDSETCGLSRNRSSLAHDLEPGFNNLLTRLSKSSVNPMITRKTPTDARSSITRRSSNGSTSSPEDGVSMDLTQVGHNFGGDVSMDITEAQLGHILEVTGTDIRKSANLKEAEMISSEHYVEALGSSYPKGMETSLTASVKAKVQQQVKFDAEDNYREKTVRFSADDACMDVTQSHTVNIATVFEPQSHHSLDFLPFCGEKTVRFSANDAAMDVTRSHTVNIDTVFKPQSHQNEDFLPACGEKTVRFSASDAAMDVTQSHTVNIASNSISDSVLPPQDSNIVSTDENIDFPLSVKKRERDVGRLRRSQSSLAQTLDPGHKNSLSMTSGLWANPVITKSVIPAVLSTQECDTSGFVEHLKTQMPDVETEKASGLVSSVMENSVNKTTTDCPENDINMDMTEAQTGHIFGQTCLDGPPQCLSSTRELYSKSDLLNETNTTSQQSNEPPGLSKPNSVEMTNCPDFLDSNEINTKKEAEPRNQHCSPTAVDHDVDAAPSRKSRRISLADLHSKIRRLSHKINTAPDTVAMGSCTAPQLEHDMDENAEDKTKTLPVVEPEPEMGLGNTEENTAQSLVQEQASNTTTPFKLKTKQLMSRLSMGGFKPKLPRRSKPDDPNKVDSLGEHTRTVTVNVTNQLSNFDGDVSDIYDEELGSLEDMSETLDTRSPQKATEKQSPLQEFKMDEPLHDVFKQDFISPVHRKRRPEDENNLEDEKRIKTSTETDCEAGFQPHVVECDSNITAAPNMTTHTSDYSNSSHTASIRCEATFESTFKQSLFESQLEDYTNDAQRKLDEGTITVLEFFKLFNMDFVIHNPRQSVLPGRLLSDTDRTPMDVLKDRHITRPKQRVYETNVLDLTEKVEGLKLRMQDLDKPLRIVNRPLWEEMRNSSYFSKIELKSFGAKLKERNNLFRKMSKVQSHEMKEVLYSNLVQANLEQQQKLRGTIEEADEMIKSLDYCIGELETELAAVEEKGSENTPSLKKRQEEMQKVTEALADNERQITELEMQNKQSANKLNRLKAETRNLESHITTLHMITEWKLGEKRDNCTLYTFLHETFHLQLVYEKSTGDDADDQSERKISQIKFKHQLDDGKSEDHVCLVHKLLSQYIEGEPAWVEKYPTSSHVPKLLHDVSLVVSHCRLLGEELRLLKMWGGLRLDILRITCVDTRVHIVFSSLKKFSKFEVVFSISLANHLYVLQVHNFKNLIGSTTIQQIEEIVSSFSPGRNVLTKIIKKIHENLPR